MRNLIIALRLITGILFLFSGVSKLLTIDEFEVYVFSLKILSLNGAFLVSRILIGLEFIIGLLLIVGIYLKPIVKLTIMTLILFSIFIAFLVFTQESEHCHCFGSLIEMSHWASLLKNIAIIAVLFVIIPKTANSINKRFQKVFLFAILLFSSSTPFIISPPDNFSNNSNVVNDYNENLLAEFLENNSLNSEKQLICFYGPTCKFCKLSAKKIRVIAERTNWNQNITNVYWGAEKDIDLFIYETKSSFCNQLVLEPKHFLSITKGQMPLILLVEKGEVKYNFGYRDIDESKINGFF